MQRFALNDGLVQAASPSGLPALDFLRQSAGNQYARLFATRKAP